MAQQNTFRSFTRQFKVARTLRFELKPYNDRVREILAWDKPTLAETLFAEEIERNRLRPALKRIWNDVIYNFTQRFLRSFAFNEADLQEAYQHFFRAKQTKGKEDQEAFLDQRKRLREALHNALRQYQETVVVPDGKKTKQVKLTSETIRKSDVYPVLRKFAEEKKDEEAQEALRVFEKFFSKVQDLVRNRTHLFENDARDLEGREGKSGQLVTRIVDENLTRFFANCALLEKIKEAGIPLSPEEEAMFRPAAYNQCLTQEGIERYNAIIGGEGAEAYRERAKGINNRINEHNQTAKQCGVPPLPLLLPLYRSIGALKERKIEVIESDDELLEQLRAVLSHDEPFVAAIRSLIEEGLLALLQEESEETRERRRGMFLTRQGVRRLAQELVSEWKAFEELFSEPDASNDGKKVRRTKKQQPKKKRKEVSLAELLAFLDRSEGAFRSLKTGKPMTKKALLEQLAQNLRARFDGGEVRSAVSDRVKEEKKSLTELRRAFAEAVEAYAAHHAKEEGRVRGEAWRSMKQAWRVYLEALVEVGRLLTLFPREEQLHLLDADPSFTGLVSSAAKERAAFNPARTLQLVRSYLTKTEQPPEELRVFFQPNFLDNWSKTKVEAGRVALAQDPEGNPCLLVFRTTAVAKRFLKACHSKDGKRGWSAYLFQQAKVNTLLPTLVRMPDGVDSVRGRKDPDGRNRKRERAMQEHLPPEIYQILQEVGFKKENNRQYLGDDRFDRFIRYYQECAREYLAQSGFSLSFKPRYDSWKEFVDDVQRQAVQWDQVSLDAEFIEEGLEKGVLLIFRICNRDLCAKTKPGAKKNIHTIIFEALLSEGNTKVRPPHLKIGAEGKIFMREARSGARREKVLPSGKKVTRETEGGEVPVFEHHRYSEKKFTFHLPVFINDDLPPIRGFSQLNQSMAEAGLLTLRQSILGVDRGERDLLAYALIDGDDRLIEAGSLNIINGVDYQHKLKEREKERTQARKEWEEVGNITNLKEGYLSYALHEIVKRSLDNDAVIGMEALAFRFMQKRGGKFERSVYLQFERDLLNKLELVVEKEKQDQPFQAVEQAPQLASTAGKQATKDFKGQDGIVFFVLPDYTSKTCPHCGYRQERTFNYSNMESAKQQLCDRLISIAYDSERQAYRIAIRREDDGSECVLWSDVDRIVWDAPARKVRRFERGAITAALERVLGEGAEEGALPGFTSRVAGFHLNPMGEISADTLIEQEVDATTMKALFFYLNRVFAVRSYISEEQAGEGEGHDFFLCPRCGFDTRKSEAYASHPNESIRHLCHLKDGDMVGAYNIARKTRLELRYSLGEEKKPRKNEARQQWDKYVYRKNGTFTLLFGV